VTQRDLDDERMKIGSAFAKRLTDPQFRAHLKSIGWKSGQHVVPALDDEPAVRVIARMFVNATPSPALIAIPADEEPFGFRLMFAEIAQVRRRPPWRRRIPTIPPEASIGMIYSALHPCGEYVPNEWSQRVLFERAAS
jgi:hypothetical protein